MSFTAANALLIVGIALVGAGMAALFLLTGAFR